ncbi:uncharacterized protein LOC142168286 [Nicotiana tabacum]|uniref:Uncharacterized protein LOC142168286 n=1 Tax=Nicotiana tabacum TaxID=4097 RepID=A0AC58SJB1_TOBAC
MERLDLWDHLYYLASDMELPWLVGGDFNVLLHEDEKIGGLPVHPPEYEDFAFCVNSCGLFEQGYKGSPFTWWNGRSNAECIFKRLDRIFVNLPFQNMLATIEVEHLIRTGSDHAPLLMTCGVQTTKFVKPFRFLNFWTKHATFMDVMRQNWGADFIGDQFLMFKQNIKRVKAALSKWNRETFGDIFKQLAILEDIVRVKEMLFEEEPTTENRIVLQKAQSELKKYLNIEEQYWKQKTGMNWFAEGDRNTSFFHNHVNGKRKKLQLKRIKSGNGVWIEDQEQLVTAAVDFYQKQFTNEGDDSEFPLLNNVPSMVTIMLLEVRAAVFELSGESASGPDGFTGLFYQTCWDVIGADIHNMVLHFYGGAALPKSITHTNLVLLPKKPRVETFSDLRPISLSNFINKVLSRVLHDRLEIFLPSLIAPNQSGFVKGRSIFENILLTQEIVTDIRLRGKPANVVIKLDMAKAYDRVSWKYLLHVLRKMGFSEHFINMVWNLMSNNWYSVLVNGQSSGFFKSTRGVKQGDPLSPALFILSAEVLSRSLNKLFEDKSFVGFGMPKWSDSLNHLAYADDTIIFASAHLSSLNTIMAVWGTMRRYQALGATTGFARGKFPFTYLGCPIFYTRRRKDYYEELIKKVKAKLHSWKGKLLSFGGKATLISSVLQSMPVHMLSVLDPPNNILGHLHKTFARFFWSTKEEGRSRYWASWKNLCLPKEEGGIGFRSLNDVSRALFAKLWWRFRTTKSLWSNFIWNKYSKKEPPTVVRFRRGSHVWRQMLNAREEVEHEIVWELKSGTTNIWHENWTGLGALYHVLPEDFPINEGLQEVAELRQGETWDDQLLDQTFNEEIAEHIRLNVHYEGSEGYWDKPYWMPTPSGKFSVSSAWQILRHRADPNQEFKLMWIKGLPFKISFFLWRLWRQKIAIDDIWRRQGQIVMSRYWCCQQPQEESIEHIFVTSPTASKVWNLFMGAAGISVQLIQLKQIIRHWWYAQCCPKLKPLFQAVPVIITWELWKRRNAGKHGGSTSTNRVIHEINRTLHQLGRVRYAWINNIPLIWPDMIQYFEGYKPILITTRVTWQLPCHGWYKCNTDGASKGNSGPSSLGFYVRDDEGDVVYARAVDLGVTTNMVAEAKAILQGLEYCTSEFHSFSELPSAWRRLINLDKYQSPNLRIRIAKRRTPSYGSSREGSELTRSQKGTGWPLPCKVFLKPDHSWLLPSCCTSSLQSCVALPVDLSNSPIFCEGTSWPE